MIKFRSKIADAVACLCKVAMKSRTSEPVWDWLYVLPLYHFMKDDLEPYMKPEYDPSKIFISARAKELDLTDVKNKVPIGYAYVKLFMIAHLSSCNSRFVDQHYTLLEPLFTADPLLLHDFIYLCQGGDYQKLFGRIPAHLSLINLSNLSSCALYFRQDKVNAYSIFPVLA